MCGERNILHHFIWGKRIFIDFIDEKLINILFLAWNCAIGFFSHTLNGATCFFSCTYIGDNLLELINLRVELIGIARNECHTVIPSNCQIYKYKKVMAVFMAITLSF